MEWLVSNPRRKAGGSGFFALIASMLIGVFASSLFAVTPIFAQGVNNNQPANQPQNTQTTAASPLAADPGSCNVASMGWWICGPTMWMAGGMDTMYDYLNEFMKVRPLEVSDQSSGFYKTWDIMRTIANSVFIIALMIIIYSQITSLGISTYGIKKMASRLIIAAILVNLSYTICAIAIDLSNISGIAIKDIFTNITQQAVAGEANRESIGTADIAQSFLAGGTLVVGGGLALQGVTTAATPFFVPILAMLFLSLLVALLVMAARQALIIILMVISPIAFVLYLLPGTEKWFDKWKDAFLVMMIFFPAFAVVFGGSELAGVLIMSNSSTLVMYLLGFAVMFIPLAITPFILKLSGGILNRFAGIINDPTKGLVDKSKEWARNKSKSMIGNSHRRMDEAQKRREESISQFGKNRGGRRGRRWYDPAFGGARRIARGMDSMGRQTKEDAEWAEEYAKNHHLGTTRHRRRDLMKREAQDVSSLLEQKNASRYDELKAGRAPADLPIRLADRARDGARGVASTVTLGIVKRSDTAIEQQDSIRVVFENIAAEGMRKTNNQRALNEKISRAILTNDKLKEKAGGIYEFGEEAAMASAIAAMRSDYGKAVEEGAEIVKHFNLSSEQRQHHALGRGEFTVVKDGVSHTFTNDSVFTREHAIEEQIATGTVPEVSEIIAASGSSLAQYKTTIAAALKSSGVKGRAPMLGGKLINDVGKGDIQSQADLQQFIVDWVKEGKFKESELSGTDKYGLELIISSIGAAGSAARAAIGEESLKGLSKQIDNVFKVPELRANMADNAEKTFKSLRSSLPDPDPDP